MRKIKALGAVSALVLACAAASAASAGEIIAGAYAHDVTFIGSVVGVGSAGRESGADLMLGLRSDRIHALDVVHAPQAHIMGSLNTDGTSPFIAAGLSWPFPIAGQFYFRPGIGLAYTWGKVGLPPANAPGLSADELARRIHLNRTRIDFGSNVLFEPEIAFGVHLTPKLSAETSWVHLSNGRILGRTSKNQGLDDAGIRLAWRY